MLSDTVDHLHAAARRPLPAATRPSSCRATRVAARALLGLLLAAGLALSTWAPLAGAAAGDYDVRLTTTSGAHWMSHGRGAFGASGMRIASGAGSFVAGDYRAWRVGVPGYGSRIIGGRVSTMLLTPDAAMRGRILAGSDSGASIVLYDGGADGAIDRVITGSHDWVQVDLRATASMTTTRPGTNVLQMTAVDLHLHDDVTPSITTLSLPDASIWYGQQCVPWSTRLTDQGGGLDRASLTRVGSGVESASWVSPRIESTRPGEIVHEFSGCLGDGARVHGRNDYVLVTSDVGGQARSIRFAFRADLLAPQLAGGPADGATFDEGPVNMTFTAADADSGLAGTSFQLDGRAVAATRVGDGFTLEPGWLAVGRHAVSATATDNVGNVATVQRTFTVGDTRPPTITLSSPAASGSSTPWLSARATDGGSGVDDATWLVSVNGEAMPIEVGTGRVSGSIGALAPGDHVITVDVADRMGNVAHLVHHYHVDSVAGPEVPEVGGSSGVYVVSAPLKPVTWGGQASFTVFVVRAGRPVPGQAVAAMRGSVGLASATTNADGLATVTFVARAPGRCVLRATGTSLPAPARTLGVAPKLLITPSTTTPRVGQRVRITGRVYPALGGQLVGLEARVGGSWYPLRRWARTGADGRFSTTVVGITPGLIAVRARIGAGGGWSVGRSPAHVLRVR